MGVVKRGERSLKRLGLALARLVLRPPAHPPELKDLSALEQVLVVRQDRRLGNLVLLTSLLLGLRRAAPRARIAVVAPAGFAAILGGHPAVDRIIAVDHRRLLARPWEIASLRRKLRVPRPQLAVDASPHHAPSFLSGLITAASGAPVRLGYRRAEATPFHNLQATPPETGAAVHESVRLHDLLRAVSPALPPAPRPLIVPADGSAALAARIFRRLGVPPGCPVVGIHPGGRRHKRWPIARFEAVARELAARGVAVVVLTGPAERALLAAMAPPGPHRIYAPPTDVRGLAIFLSGLDVFVSGDCGPMHLASALGIDCVTVFRIGDDARYRPLGPRHRILYREAGDVEPAEVLNAVGAILGSQGRPPALRANRSG